MITFYLNPYAFASFTQCGVDWSSVCNFKIYCFLVQENGKPKDFFSETSVVYIKVGTCRCCQLNDYMSLFEDKGQGR